MCHPPLLLPVLLVASQNGGGEARVTPPTQITGQSASGPVNPASASNNSAQGASIANELQSAIAERRDAVDTGTSSLAILASLPNVLTNHLKKIQLEEAMWTAVINLEREQMIFLEVTPRTTENTLSVLHVASTIADRLKFTENRSIQQSFFQAIEITDNFSEIERKKWRFPLPTEMPDIKIFAFMSKSFGKIPFQPEIKEFVIIPTFSGKFRIFYNFRESRHDEQYGHLCEPTCRDQKIEQYKKEGFVLVELLELIRRQTEINSRLTQTNT